MLAQAFEMYPTRAEVPLLVAWKVADLRSSHEDASFRKFDRLVVRALLGRTPSLSRLRRRPCTGATTAGRSGTIADESTRPLKNLRTHMGRWDRQRQPRETGFGKREKMREWLAMPSVYSGENFRASLDRSALL